MKKFSWKAPAVYVAIGAIAGSLMAAPAAMAGQNFRPYWAKFSQNGEQSSSAQAILYGGTNYFGIYYLQQLLKKDGIDATWNGSELSLNGVPMQKTTTLSVSGSSQMNPTSPLLTNAITVNGVTYVPLAAVQAMLTNAGVRLNEGDHQLGSSGISVGKVQSIISHLKDAEQSLSQYVKTSMQAQMQQAMGKHVDQGDAKDAVHHLMDAMAKLQSAYAALTALEASMSANNTSSGVTVTGSVYGTNTGTLAQTLSTIASALQADVTTLNGVVMGSAPSFGNTGGSSNTGTSSGSTSATSDFASVVSDITTQIGQLYQVESQLQQSQVNSGSQDN